MERRSCFQPRFCISNCATAEGAAVLMLAIARDGRIVAAKHGVGVSPLAMAALDANFSAAIVLHDLLRPQFGFALRREDGAGAIGVGLFHRPSIRVVHHISVVLVHWRPPDT